MSGLNEDYYTTIKDPAKGLFKSKGSKFIAYLLPCQNQASFERQLALIKEVESSARHHCWAYRLGYDDPAERSNDDGEPSNTAGTPILRQLTSNNLTNVGCVVVRYFGGTKLGVPGLIEAYGASTKESIQSATLVNMAITKELVVRFNYEDLSFVERVAREDGVEIVDRKQESTLTYTIRILRSKFEEIHSTLESNHRITCIPIA
jgi:uncharacterized YigZ family protein